MSGCPGDDQPGAGHGPLYVGATHGATATVLGAAGTPLANLIVDLVVSGANPATIRAKTNAQGVATFSYAGAVRGTDTLVARAGAISSNSATVVWNSAPVAIDQSVTTTENTALPSLFAGSDVDGDALTFGVLTQPEHGTLNGTAPSLTYTPATDYHGPDTFTFQVNDSLESSNVATVSITVTAATSRRLATTSR